MHYQGQNERQKNKFYVYFNRPKIFESLILSLKAELYESIWNWVPIFTSETDNKKEETM